MSSWVVNILWRAMLDHGVHSRAAKLVSVSLNMSLTSSIISESERVTGPLDVTAKHVLSQAHGEPEGTDSGQGGAQEGEAGEEALAARL
jgi:hypothetical protein